MLQIYHIKWYHPNRVWIFNDGALKDEPLYFGFDRIITSLLEKQGAVKYRRALHNGCMLILSDSKKPSTFKFNLISQEGMGGKYSNDEFGMGWIDCEYLIGCLDELYIGLEVE
jgi:hypothetical protein